MNKERNRFKKPTGEKHDKAFTDKWFAYLNGDSKAKEGVTYKNVFLDDFEKMELEYKKIYIFSLIYLLSHDLQPLLN